MVTYSLNIQTADGLVSQEELRFPNDAGAIMYSLQIAQGRALELRRGDKLLATIDERACVLGIKRELERRTARSAPASSTEENSCHQPALGGLFRSRSR